MAPQRCPIDRVELTQRTVGPAVVAFCGDCGGLWLPRQARAAPSADPSQLPDVTQKSTDGSHPLRKYKMCPACGIALSSEKIKGIEIDRCTKCDGVWLDAGEYAAVRSRIEIRSAVARRAKTKDSPVISIRAREQADGRRDDDGNGPLDIAFAIVEAILEFIPK